MADKVWTEDERNDAEKQLLSRLPALGSRLGKPEELESDEIAAVLCIDLQCELNEVRELLNEARIWVSVDSPLRGAIRAWLQRNEPEKGEKES